jgi:hypothetical protein
MEILKIFYECMERVGEEDLKVRRGELCPLPPLFPFFYIT